MVKIIHFPYTKRNPYQMLLIDALEDLNLKVKWSRDSKFGFLNISILKILIHNWRPDILHLHWHHSGLLAIGQLKTIIKSTFFILQLLLLKIFKIKFVWTVHNLTHHENRYNKIELFFCKYIGCLADAIIVHCKSAKLEVQKAFKLKADNFFYVIPHGSYLGFYKNTVSIIEAKKILHLSGNQLTFIFFGDLRPYKGIPELIRAFKKLDGKNRQPIGLMIIGRPLNDKFAREIKRLADGRHNIFLKLLSIPESDLQIYFNAADIAVFPFRNVLTSGSALLAMSFGNTIIAPRLGCLKDMLTKNGSILYDSSDIKGLYNAMNKALTLGFKLSQRNSHNIEQAKKFNWQNIAIKTSEVYFKILSEFN